jgi:hypothetical protein
METVPAPRACALEARLERRSAALHAGARARAVVCGGAHDSICIDRAAGFATRAVVGGGAHARSLGATPLPRAVPRLVTTDRQAVGARRVRALATVAAERGALATDLPTTARLPGDPRTLYAARTDGSESGAATSGACSRRSAHPRRGRPGARAAAARAVRPGATNGRRIVVVTTSRQQGAQTKQNCPTSAAHARYLSLNPRFDEAPRRGLVPVPAPSSRPDESPPRSRTRRARTRPRGDLA